MVNLLHSSFAIHLCDCWGGAAPKVNCSVDNDNEGEDDDNDDDATILDVHT